MDGSLPICLSTLYNAEWLHSNYSELKKNGEKIEIAVTQDEVDRAEFLTRSQAQSRLWLRMRAGRITSSRFKAACHTDHSNPSISLIMSICHPELSKFKNLATCWGCEHELTARKKFTTSYAISHHKFEVKASGFFITTDYPFIGATPDG